MTLPRQWQLLTNDTQVAVKAHFRLCTDLALIKAFVIFSYRPVRIIITIILDSNETQCWKIPLKKSHFIIMMCPLMQAFINGVRP